MTTLKVSDLIGETFDIVMREKKVMCGNIEQPVQLRAILTPTSNRVEFAVFMNGGSSYFMNDLIDAIDNYNAVVGY